jgi:hypothetical protein
MSSATDPTWLAEHGRGDAIRIVPLHLPGAAPAPGPPPQLTYRGGPLIQAVEVFTVFWGAAWQQSPQDALAQRLNQFFDTILTSALIDQLAEYDAGGQTIGHGRRVGTTTLTTPAPRHSVSDTALQRLLNEQIASNAAFPQPTANTLYFLYLPPGTTVTQGGSRSCQAFCGYHSDINGQIFYAVMPYPGCAGCVGGLAPADALTSTSSHELCEAITDPIPGQGWYDDTHGEIGDICAWQTRQLAGYTVQLEWSNRQGQCV